MSPDTPINNPGINHQQFANGSFLDSHFAAAPHTPLHLQKDPRLQFMKVDREKDRETFGHAVVLRAMRCRPAYLCIGLGRTRIGVNMLKGNP